MTDAKPLRPLDDAERDHLADLLDGLPLPLEPLDLSALDGFLVGVLLQPQAVPQARWLCRVHDLDARPAPRGLDLAPLHSLVLRRHAELDRAIGQRAWFDPWVFELEADEHDGDALPSQVVLPWVAGFAAALDTFPALLKLHDTALREPLAVLYANFDPDDLEDADDLQAEIDALEPATTVAEAVEDLVRCTLLLADVSRPQPRGATMAAKPARRPSRPAARPRRT